MTEQQKNEWLAARKTGIGSTDISAIVGVNKWRSALDVWLDKTTPDIADIDNEPMYWGRKLEPFVAERYSEETGNRVRKVNTMRRHADYDFLFCTPDYIIIGSEEKTRRGVEIKTAGQFAADDFTDTQVPPQYYIQVQWMLACTGYDSWDLAVLIGGNSYRQYRFERHEQLITQLVSKARQWWQAHIVEQQEPTVTTYNDAAKLLHRKSDKTTGELLDGDEVTRLLAIKYKTIKSKSDELAAELDGIKAQIAQIIGNNDGIAAENYKFTYKYTKPKPKTDYKTLSVDLLAALPENDRANKIAEYTTQPDGSRVLRPSLSKLAE